MQTQKISRHFELSLYYIQTQSSLPFLVEPTMATAQNNAFLITIFHSPEDKAAELLLG